MEFQLPKSFWWTQTKTHFSINSTLFRLWKDIHTFYWCFLFWTGCSINTNWSKWKWICNCLYQPWINQLWAQLFSNWDRMFGCSLGYQILSPILIWSLLSTGYWSLSTLRYFGKITTNWKSSSLDIIITELSIFNHTQTWQNQLQCRPTFSHSKSTHYFYCKQRRFLNQSQENQMDLTEYYYLYYYLNTKEYPDNLS